MLKLMLLTSTHSSNAETDDFDHGTHPSQAEADDFDHDSL
jgi:hypothetical protein